jgi:hypothetical protein
VVLVEGDSDYIVFPHLARLIDPVWDCGQLPVRFARIGGKGNIRRYRDFFRRFGAQVLVVADLDFLLGNEFTQIEPSESLRTERDKLIAAIDSVINANGDVPEPKAERIKRAHEKGDLRELWRRARQLQAQYKEGKATLEAVTAAVEEFFSWEKYWTRRDVLKECPNAELRAQKHALLENLRAQGIFVLEKGTIEDYYPTGVVGESKPSKAQSFCNTVTTKEQALALCTTGHRGPTGASASEFEAICRTIFEC